MRNVSRVFGSVTAVEQIDIHVLPGEFFSLLGPSGCGKTTTLRLIAGFEEPSTGAILIRGETVHRLPPYRRNVNTVFQSYALFPHLDVFENVAFGLRRKGCPRHEIKTRVDEALQRVHLQGFEKRRPRQMSGGEQQRVAIARAIVNTPAVLLLDEPLSALDEKLRRQMQVEMKTLQRDLGISFILVTHDQEEALTLSDRMAVMNRGRIEQVGTPAEIYESPASRFVTSFIGATNFLTGDVTGREDDLLVVDLGQDQRILVPTRQDSGDSSREFFVRPEKMWLLPHPPPPRNGSGPLNSLRGRLVDRIYQGPVTRYRVEVVNGLEILVSSQNDAPLPDTGSSPGDPVWVQWHPQSTRAVQDKSEKQVPVKGGETA